MTDHLAEHRRIALEMEIEMIESELAPSIRKCVERYGKEGTKRALTYIMKNLKEANG